MKTFFEILKNGIEANPAFLTPVAIIIALGLPAIVVLFMDFLGLRPKGEHEL